jgi:hypothetical protein
LEALSRLTGAVNRSSTSIANGTGTPIAPGDPLYFQIASGFAGSVSTGVVNAIQNAVTNVAVDVTLQSSDPRVKIINHTGVRASVGSGQTSTFDVEFIGDGVPHRFDLQFVRAGTNVVLGSIPVVLGTPVPGSGYEFEDLNDGQISTSVDFGSSKSVVATTPTINLNGGSFTFDTLAHAATATATGIGGVTVPGTFAFTYNGSSVDPTNAGAYTVVATFTSTDLGYANATATGTLTILAATPTLTLTGGTFVYDTTAHVASGLASGIAGSVVTGNLVFTYNASLSVPVSAGTYDVSASFTSADPNYSNATGTSTIVIKQASLNVTADAQTKVYGAALPALTFTQTGLLGGDSFVGSLATTATAGSDVAAYPILLGSLSAGGNYAIHFTTNNLLVTPAPLAVVADSKQKVYGAAVPTLTYSYSGLVNKDTATVFTGGLVTTVTTSTNVADYPITRGTLSAGNNYAIDFTPGTLSVTKAHLTVTASVSSSDIGHGDLAPFPTATLSGFVNGDDLSALTHLIGFNGMPTPTSSAGVYTVTPTTALLSALNYDFPNLVPTTVKVHPKMTDVIVKWGTKSLSILNSNRDLPFFGINGIEVKFSDPVNITGTGLSLTSTTGGPGYFPSRLGSGLDTADVSWALPKAIDIDNLLASLDAANIGAAIDPSIKLFGSATKAFSVLPGDFSGDRNVASDDMTAINNATVLPYNIFADVNGDGKVDINDVKAARSRIGKKLV